MLVLASASPRRSELLTQAGYSFTIHPAHIPEDPLPNEDPATYVTRLALEKAQAVFREITGAPCLDSETLDTTVFAELSPKSPAPPQVVPGAPGPSHLGTRETTNFNLQPLIVLGADTTVTLDNHILGKPENDADAGAPGPSHLGTRETTNFNLQPLIVLGADTTVTLDNHILGKPENDADAARMLRLLSGRTHQVITGIAIVSPHAIRTAAESTTVQFLPLTDAQIAAYIRTREPMDKAGAYAIQGRAARWIPRIEGCYFNVVGLPIALVSSLLQSLDASLAPSNL
jgi:septum formation protein